MTAAEENRRGIWLSVLGAVAVALGTLSLLAHLPAWRQRTVRNRFMLSRSGKPTKELRRGRFQFMHVTEAATIEPLVGQTQAFVEAVMRRWSKPLKIEPDPAPVRIYLFESLDQLRGEYRKQFRGRIDNNGGFYHPLTGELVIVVTKQASRGVYHELVHMMLDRWSSGKKLAAWLEEGLATYLEQYDPEAGPAAWGRLDSRLVQHAQTMLAARRWIPHPVLTKVKAKAFTGSDNLDYYAASYLLVHYLLHADDGKRRGALFEQVAAERQGGKMATPLVERLGTTPKELARSWRAYVAGLK